MYGKILFDAWCFYILNIMWISLTIDTIFICSYMNYIYVIFAILNEAPALSCAYALCYLFIITVFLSLYIYSFASTYGLLAYYAYILYQQGLTLDRISCTVRANANDLCHLWSF